MLSRPYTDMDGAYCLMPRVYDHGLGRPLLLNRRLMFHSSDPRGLHTVTDSQPPSAAPVISVAVDGRWLLNAYESRRTFRSHTAAAEAVGKKLGIRMASMRDLDKVMGW